MQCGPVKGQHALPFSVATTDCFGGSPHSLFVQRLHSAVLRPRAVPAHTLTDVVVGAAVDVHGLIVGKNQGGALDGEVRLADTAAGREKGEKGT